MENSKKLRRDDDVARSVSATNYLGFSVEFLRSLVHIRRGDYECRVYISRDGGLFCVREDGEPVRVTEEERAVMLIMLEQSVSGLRQQPRGA